MIAERQEPRGADCPADLGLNRLMTGELDGAAAAAMRGHVAGCRRCNRRLAGFEAVPLPPFRPHAKPRYRRLLAWGAGALAPAAIALALFFGHRAGDRSSQGWLVGKGEAGAVLRARCQERGEGRCSHGDKLIFEVNGSPEGGLLASYADGPSGRIWYFPTADGHLASVPAVRGLTLVKEFARIGDDHPPGRYTVHILLLDRAATPTEITSGAVTVRARTSSTLVVGP